MLKYVYYMIEDFFLSIHALYLIKILTPEQMYRQISRTAYNYNKIIMSLLWNSCQVEVRLYLGNIVADD